MSVTENTSVYRAGRRQGRRKRTEGVCERSKGLRKPGVLEIRKERKLEKTARKCQTQP